MVVRSAAVLLTLFAAGCLQPAPGPGPTPSGAWAKLAHDAGVAAAQARAAALRQAAAKEWKSESELAAWLSTEIDTAEAKAYQPSQNAAAEQFKDGWSWAAHKPILIEQAKGYESVR